MSLGCTTEFSACAPDDAEWRTLAADLLPASRFVTAAWIQAWGQSFLPHQNWLPPLRYLTVRGNDGRLLVVFPLAKQKQWWFSVASLGGFYWPFRSPVIPENAGAEAMTALAAAFTGSHDIAALRYGPVPETHGAIAGLNQALQDQRWRVHRVNLGETYAVELPSTWQEFERRLSKKLRQDASHDERKMRRDGELDIRCTRNAPGASWADVMSDLAAIEGKSWQWREGGKVRFVGDRNHAFWMSLFANPRAAAGISVWVMYFKSEPVSFCVCLDCSDVRHIVANNYAEQVRRYGTGSILYKYVFRDAIESGAVRRINIGLGDSGYKSRWGARPAFRLVDWISFRPGLRGRLPELAYAIRRRIQDRSADRGDADAPLAPAPDSA